MNSNFAENLKRIRKENNLSQEQLADKLGVSRQSVSKWESQQAYPEMDKVIQLCNMFNLNIDELLNKDIKEAREEKESKNRVNKYLDDFLSFITKTVNMFTSMKAKDIIKCIVEQMLILFALVILFNILDSIGGSIIGNLVNVIPYKAYRFILAIFEIAFIIIYAFISIVVMIHIFKTRYLNYYENNEKDDKVNNTKEEKISEDLKEEKEEKIEYNKKEKIIIRDPKDSEYGFINGLLKCILFFIKFCFIFVFIAFAGALVGLSATLIICLYHIFINKIFIGISLAVIGCIIINLILLLLTYSFLFNKKFYIKKLFILFLISLSLCGIGGAFAFLHATNFKLVDKEFVNTDSIEKVYNYSDNLSIMNEGYYTFKVDNNLNNDVKVLIEYNKEIEEININEETHNNKRGIYISKYSFIRNDFFFFYREAAKHLKKNEVVNFIYNDYKTTIITSENNIKNIIKNTTYQKYSILEHNNNEYSLYIDYRGDYNMCYLKDGYYNICTNVYGSYDEDEIHYSENGLIYDSEKYECENEYNEYYCERKLISS